MGTLTDLSMLDLAAKLCSRDVSSVEATKACFAQMNAWEPKVNAVVTRNEEAALKSAAESDARRARNAPASPLDGVPVGLKDMILTQGLLTTAGSKMLSNFIPPYDATVTSLLKAAGLPIVAKLNQDEFAMGSSTETSAFGPTKNPFDVTRTPGGSSGGSAAAVAAREVYGALGTDTGGSIRQPAAFTNTVGLKPTYGRVSRHGVVAYASSLDQVGPMTRTVADAGALLQVLAKHDPADSTSSTRPAPDFLEGLERGVKGLRVGLPREYFQGGLDAEVEHAIRESAKVYEKLGATLVDVSLPHTKFALAAYYLLAPAEASSNLARYDGVKFGFRADGAKSLRDMYLRTRSEGFGAEVKRRIMLGTFALSAGYYDAYYVKAQKVRTLVARDFTQAFTSCDVLLSPTSPVPAFAIGEKSATPLDMYLMDVFTIPCNLAGLPGISIPAGFTKSGLPMGLQLLGRPFDEAGLLTAARAFERECPFGKEAPRG